MKGLDIPDVALLVQFGVPSSLTVWLQRAGRAGRSPSIQARAILLVERSVLMRTGNRNKDPSNSTDTEISENEGGKQATAYRKTIEPGLRHWIETKRCQRDVADTFFDNPPGRRCKLTSSLSMPTSLISLAPTGSCCDNCALMRLSPDPKPTRVLPEPYAMLSSPASSTISLSDSDADVEIDMPSSTLNVNNKRALAAHTTDIDAPSSRTLTTTCKPPTRRTKSHLQGARTALANWRIRARQRDFKFCSFTAAAIMPDSILATIASQARLKTVDDLQETVGMSWALLDKYADEVLLILQRVDDDECVRKEAVHQAKYEASQLRKRQREEKQHISAKRRQKRVEKENIPGMLRYVLYRTCTLLLC